MSDRLNSNERLLPGQYITSQNQLYRLILQTDGNLVLYKPEGKPMWATGTNGQPVNEAIMQTDGNFVLYAPNGPVWATNTFGNVNLQRSSFLGAGHYMDTSADLAPDGRLLVSTRTRTITMFGGFTGGVTVAAADANGLVLAKAERTFGVDGTAIGRSDRTDQWEANFGANTGSLANQLLIAHYWAPRMEMEQMIRIGVEVAIIVAKIVIMSNADVAVSG